MDTSRLSWGTLLLLLLPFIGVLIVLLQRWLEPKEEPVVLQAHDHASQEHEAHEPVEQGHLEVETPAIEADTGGPAPVERIPTSELGRLETEPAPETIAEEVKSAPETIAEEVKSAPEAIAAEVKPVPEAIAAEVKPAPEAIVAEVKPVPEAIAAEVKPAPEAIAAEVKPVPEAIAAEVKSTEDDLEIIEGIGPKIARILREAGITTFAQLAQTSPETLREMMKAAKVRLAAPESWPEQAQLAAEGKWEELRAYQDRLKGGR